MEEASVAGESPDRSKKRESSAEATSGSTGPVPEARSEARDPRLAVAREAEASGGSASGKAGSSGGVDTATKVFSVRDLEPEAGSGRHPESEPEPEAEEESAEGAASGGDVSADAADGPGDDAATEGDESDASGDARLRAAVAAWVRTGDSKDSGDAPGPEKAPGGAGADDSAGSEASDSAEDASAESGTDTDGERNADTDGSGGERDAADEAEPADAATDEAAGDDEAEDDVPATSEARTDADAEVVEDAASDAAASDAAASAGAASAGAASDAAASAGAASAAAATDEADDAGAPASDADAEVVEDAASDAAASAGAASAAAATDEADDADAPASDGDAEVVEDAVPEEEAEAPEDATPAGSDEPDDDSPVDESPVEDAVADGDGGGGKPAGAKHVDQPTAVFKRPAKPQVDQPTTMLKLGGAAKAPEKAPDKPSEPDEPAKTPEAERTSKFVALKPLDEPATQRPADATAAIPQVGPERTAQQPLPPKPPMDLLAELTNTPPPPVTPVRTIVRRVKIWTPLVLLLAVAFAIAQAVRPLPTPNLALTADDSYTFDGSKADLPWPSEGQGWMDVNGIGTMGNFGKQTPVAIGSVAKAMTAYIVLKDHPLKSGAEGERIKVDATAEKEGGYDKDGESTLNTVKQGDTLTEKQALSAIMIPSANNIARLLARWDSGTEAAFIKKMNDTAKDLGMKNTTYTDASGLKESTVSTAEDQVKLGNELVKIPALMDITKLPNWVDPSGHKWRNYNALVPYDGALGIKTGTTTKAGGNLLFAATKEVGGETVTVVGAILGQHTAPIIDTVNAVSKTAMIGAQDALTSKKILKKGDVVGYVDDQLGGHTPIVLTKDVPAVGWAGLKVKLSFDADDVPHSAKAGTQVGTLTVGDGTSGAVKVPVALQKDLTEPGFGAKLKRIT
ncbi:D-alanyl-D-alanine carboxypeptidase [Streptomyces sp. NPDC048419]|uniref:D-alanyl-D-alanine carboxypeptidase n=1 Tax=Streptomyces sp. NPDC048419 TaxID=3365547 RepID=UPI003722739B